MTSAIGPTETPTARNARRFETYVRWSLYAFALVEATYLVQTVVIVGYALSGLVWAGVAIGLVHVVLDVLVGSWAFTHLRRRGPVPRALLGTWVTSGVVTVVCFLPWTSPRTPWPIIVPAVVVVSLCMVTPLMSLRTALLSSAGVGVLAVALALVLGMGWGYRIGYLITVAGMAAFVIVTAWSLVWMLKVLFQLQDAQEAQARLAVADERLRISRDLHDVFGRTLATIAVKAELAAELVRRERSTEAAAELTEIRAIADSAGKEVRRVVRGESTVGLAQELEGARALLTSAGIATVVAGQATDVEPATSDVLAWIVREAVTNVLRHSAASQASVSVAVDREATTLMVANDGADLTGTSGSRTGIASMRDRLSACGGTLEVTHDGGWFTLVASVPARQRGVTPPIHPTSPIVTTATTTTATTTTATPGERP